MKRNFQRAHSKLCHKTFFINSRFFMVFSEMAYFLPSREVPNNQEELSSIQLESVKPGNKVLNDYIFFTVNWYEY